MKTFFTSLAIATLSASAAFAGPIGAVSGGGEREEAERGSIVSAVVGQVKFSLAKFAPSAGETKAKPRTKRANECEYSGHPGHEMAEEDEAAKEEEKASGPEPMYFGF